MVERVGQPGLLGLAAVHDLVVRDDPVVGDERVLDDDVLAAGAAQAHDVPGVLDDLVVGPGQDEVQRDRRPGHLALGVAEHAAQEDPVAVVGARGELPASVEDVAPVDRPGDPHRRVRRGDPGVLVLAPDLLLDPRVGERHLPGVHAHDARHPAGRSVEAGQLYDRLGVVAGVELEAAVGLRLEHPDDARLPQHLGRLVVQPAQRLVGGAERADLVGPLCDRVEYRVGHGFSHFFAARATAISMSWSSCPPMSLRRPASMRISAPDTPYFLAWRSACLRKLE